MKKIISVLLALVMTLALSVSALAVAQEGTLTGGSITINDAVPGQTYSVYQILYLESYNAGSNAYSYKANSEWEAWLKTQTEYIKIDNQGYVTWVGDQTAERAQAFAKLAQKELANKNAAATATAPAAATGATYSTVSFANLKLGYYLIDTTLGTLCSLDTTNPNVVMQEKNEVPTNVKTVEEDSTPGVYGEKNDADIGQTVNFKSTITAQPGAENYVFEDTMSAGLTYKNDAKVYTDENMTKELDAKHYTVNNNPGGGKTFTITFNQDYLNTITAATKLYVKYSATLNENAKVGLDGNSNKSTLKYGDANNTKSTPDSETKTYTWDLDVLKYANGDKSKVLENAQFVLLNKDKNKVATVVNGKLTGWVDFPAAGADGTITWPENIVLTTNAQGKIEIDGLDADTYYLREVKAPAGYNILKDDVKVEITGATKGENDTLTYTTVVAEINNQTGTELPSTGGMGTTIFYVLGGVLMAGAFVLLVVRKRMRTE